MSLFDTRLRPEEIQRLRNGLHIMAVHALEDQEAAEEVVQETLVRTLQAVNDDRRESPKNLGAFVRGIATSSQTCTRLVDPGYRWSPCRTTGAEPRWKTPLGHWSRKRIGAASGALSGSYRRQTVTSCASVSTRA